MNNFFKLIYLILILTLNFSCVEKKSSEKEISKSEFVDLSKTDTLKFNSGIRAIFQDSKGNYWIGSHKEGVCLFDGKSFQYFTKIDGLPDNQIYSIKEDEIGNIWFGTAKGVSSYNSGKIINHILTTVDKFLQSEWNKADNDLWFSAGNNAGIFRYDGQKVSYLAFPNPIIVNTDNVYFVTGLAKGKNDILWIGTYSGVFGYNGKEFTIINDETLELKNETGQLHIRSILEDSKGNLWIGNNGIGVLLKSGDSIINFSDKNRLIHPNSRRNGDTSPNNTLEHVFVIEEDSEGNLWFGDRDTGVWKFDGKTMTNYIIDEKLSTPMIWSIYNDNNNNLLFGMASGGVYKFNGKSFDKTF